MKKNRTTIFTALFLLIAGTALYLSPLTAEYPGPKPTPPEEDFPPYKPGTPFRLFGGNADEGKKAFEQLNCIQCHKIKGVEVAEPESKRRLTLTLGEEKRFVTRYEDIILAISNPRHVINEQYRGILSQAELNGEIEPFMPDLTDHMTVRQLIDVVAFLDSVYSKAQPEYQSPE